MDECCAISCARLRELGAELALGVLPARERAAAVEHLDRCARCRDEVHRLTLVGDALLSLVPGAEPPVGFEDRVLARLRPSLRAVRRPHRGRRLVLAAAAATAALAVGAGGWALGSTTGASGPSGPSVTAGAQVRSVGLVAGGRTIGEVHVADGPSPWLYMSVDADGVAGPVRCAAQRSDGSVVALGTFPLKNGYAYWGTPYPAGPPLTAVRLLNPDGTVLATATLR